jgi:hypothetical protein
MNTLILEIPPKLLDEEINALERASHSIIDLSVLDLTPAMHLSIQFLFNILMCSAVIWLFYYPKSHHKGFSVTFMLFSAAVFMLLYFMGGVSLDITVGLGLFMIFGIMRYRTEIAHSEMLNFGDNDSAMALYSEYARYPYHSISPALSTCFVRITLVNPKLTERLTIDLALRYKDIRSDTEASIPGMAIVELKQDGNIQSSAKLMMRDMHIAPLKVSKYCLGTTLTVEGIKSNRFKAKVRDIEKRLQKGLRH